MKKALLSQIKNLLDQRLQTAWDAMQAAQASANEEGKSSAGDKYETARAMGQLDRDMYGRQYEQVRQERLLLEKIQETERHTTAGFGALVQTSAGWYCLAVSVGIVTQDGEKVMVVSPQSPIGQALLGKKAGDSFSFRGKNERILATF
ncbi:MAG: GreA/GreB family elongation factor [Spirosomataceae bacterium]